MLSRSPSAVLRSPPLCAPGCRRSVARSSLRSLPGGLTTQPTVLIWRAIAHGLMDQVARLHEPSSDAEPPILVLKNLDFARVAQHRLCNGNDALKRARVI